MLFATTGMSLNYPPREMASGLCVGVIETTPHVVSTYEIAPFVQNKQKSSQDTSREKQTVFRGTPQHFNFNPTVSDTESSESFADEVLNLSRKD
ncbi:unnamed protein product [Strongylus vulgaris]|uniref:Uncharacterized protein n=1 Tax=Strongylus vulgaris TaxID=40348 RepID=A0A3P7JNU0_STRVU|nr:unnamed protein product [Strongylus vulgaris]